MNRKKAPYGKRMAALIIDMFAIIALFFVFEFAAVNPIMKSATDNVEVSEKYTEIDNQYKAIQDEYGIYIYDNGKRVQNKEVSEETQTNFNNDSRVIALKEEIKPYGNKLIKYSVMEYSIALFLAALIELFVLPLIFKDGKSLGKILMRITINNDDYSRIKWYQLLVRFLVQFIFEIYLGIFTMLLSSLLSLVISSTNRKNKTLPDLIAKTMVYSDLPIEKPVVAKEIDKNDNI